MSFLTAFEAIGGRYLAFVLAAYGASLIAFGWMVIDTLARGRAARRTLERLEAQPPDDAP